MQCKLIVGAVAALLAAANGATLAAPSDRGWYGDVDVGRSDLRLNGGDIDNALANQGIAGSSSLDRRDTALGANVGYRLNRNFALEGGYTEFGKFKVQSATSAPAADTVDGDYKAHAWSFAAVGIAPLEDGWSLFGKAGAARTTADLTASSETGATAPGGASHSGTGLLLGAGATYDFTDNLYGKVELDRYTRVGDSSTGKGDVDLYTVGVGVRF
jgi:OmpA-OmpF porin, OOP family